MSVAIEHENDSNGFEHEVQKLLSVRCPLKVGITYTQFRTYDDCDKQLKAICDNNIKPYWDRACVELGQEPSNTEYLFLVGHEEQEAELKWYTKSFRVRNGYQTGFEAV